MSDEECIKIAVAGGGEIILKGVDSSIIQAAKTIAKHGIYAFAVHSDSRIKPVYHRISEISSFVSRLMNNRFNYGLEYKDFRYYFYRMDEINDIMNDLQMYYSTKKREAKEAMRNR